MVENRIYNIWLLALGYSILYVFVIPWTDIWGREFEDIANYLFRIAYLQEGGTEAEHTGIKWLLDEPIWKYIILALGETFEDYRLSLYFVAFVALTLYGSFFFRRVEFYIVMLLMLNPMSVNLHIEQIRISLAFSLVLVAYDIRSRYLAILFLAVAFMIHASMPIFLGVYFLLYKMNQKLEARKFYLGALGIALGMALFMKFGLNAILTAVGDRHAGYGDIAGGSSLAYSIVWFMIAFIIAIFANFENNKERLLAGYAIVFMSFFFFGSILGIYGQRYVAVIMPIIIIAIGYLPKHIKQGVYLMLFAYNLFMFKYWFQFYFL